MLKKTWNKFAVAIVGTVLSYGVLAAIEVPKAEAAVLTYNFTSFGSGSFSFDNSSITGNDYEETTVLNGIANIAGRQYSLAGQLVSLYEGKLVGLNGYLGYSNNYVFHDEEEGWTFSKSTSATWSFSNNGPYSLMAGYEESYCNNGYGFDRCDSWIMIHDEPVYYSLAPEPLTIAGTVLGLAGLVRLKQSKNNS